MMRWFLSILLLLLIGNKVRSQGLNHVWLLGNNPSSTVKNGRAFIDSNNFNKIVDYRDMAFKGTQSNICDSSGNFLMGSNGIYLMNATNDTMENGDSLNPNGVTSQFPYGLPIIYNSIILPHPGDTNLYDLIHHTLSASGVYYSCFELYVTTIDMSQNFGLGKVISKNQIAFQDSLNGGIAVCKHANGRDWWIVMQKHNSDSILVFLLNPVGMQYVSTQKLYVPYAWYSSAQLTFSQDGSKLTYTLDDSTTTLNGTMVVCDFDRCSGTVSNGKSKLIEMGRFFLGCAFSKSGNYIYACTSFNIFQIDPVTLTVDTVAAYDGFFSPDTICCPTTFWNMYLAANGKIFVTTGSSTQHITVINNPDSAGLLCDVQQHSIDLVDYLHLRAVPNHPNYYLGCDTTLGCGCATSYNQYSLDDDKFKIYPNPNNGSFNIGYKAIATSSLLKVIDVNGKVVYEQYLAPWSNEQSVSCKNLHPGIYFLKIESGTNSVSKKMVVTSD